MLRIVSLLNIILGRTKSSLKYNDRPDEFIDHPVSLRKSFYDTNISFICTVSEIKKAFLNQWVFKNAKANIICKVKYTLIIFKDVYLPCCVKLVCRQRSSKNFSETNLKRNFGTVTFLHQMLTAAAHLSHRLMLFLSDQYFTVFCR